MTQSTLRNGPDDNGLFGFGQFGTFFFDDFGRGLVNERGIRQFAAHSRNFAVQALDFLVQARQLCIFVDQAGHGYQHFHFTNQSGGGQRRFGTVLQHGDRFELSQLFQQGVVFGQAALVFAADLRKRSRNDCPRVWS